MAFVFYDLETTGLDTRHDQILHFAAIRTDADLIEQERVELRCRLDRHVVPHPAAMVLTGRTLAELRAADLPSHYEMMRRVAQHLEKWSPATIIGFNSVRFDEEVLRHSLWRTLHNPYLTSWAGNVRADALTLCRTVAFFAPGALTVPVDEEGSPRFRLPLLVEANDIAVGTSHAAMDDAAATLALCRLVMERDGETWWRFLRFAAKPAAAALVDSAQPFGTVRFRGNEPSPTAAVLVGASSEDPNRRHCLDLASDLDRLAARSDDGLQELLTSQNAPTFRLRVNACPALCEIWELPPEARSGLGEDELEARATRARNDPRLAMRMHAILERLATPRAPADHLEEQLYDALPNRADEPILRQFHEAPWRERSQLLTQVEDARTRRLGRRLLFAEAPETLDSALRARFEAEVLARLTAPAATRPFRTVADALAAAAAMGDTCPAELAAGLAELGSGTRPASGDPQP